MYSVVQEAYVKGVSTRKVESLVAAMGIDDFDKSRVSRMCEELDELVTEWRTQPIETDCPYVWVDAKYVHVRCGARTVKKAIFVAFAVREDGYRRVLGLDVFELESEATWRTFLQSLRARGLSGVRLVISDAHEGLKKAAGTVFLGANWQRCTVHFVRNIEGHLPRSERSTLRALLCSAFKQPSREGALAQLRKAADALRPARPRVAELIDEAEDSVLAFYDFPQAHHQQLRSTNTLERLNKEIARRVNVVGIFPTDKSVLRLVGALLMEQDEEWLVGRRYLSLESMALLKTKEPPPPLLTEEEKAA